MQRVGHFGATSRRMVVGIDGSDTARRALHAAIGLARALDAELTVVSAYRPVPERQLRNERTDAPDDVQWRIGPRAYVDSVLEAAEEEAIAAGMTIERVAVEGRPAAAILEVAADRNADVIVVGNQGMAGARRVLGSVPNAVSHNAHCSVLIVNTSSNA